METGGSNYCDYDKMKKGVAARKTVDSSMHKIILKEKSKQPDWIFLYL